MIAEIPVLTIKQILMAPSYVALTSVICHLAEIFPNGLVGNRSSDLYLYYFTFSFGGFIIARDRSSIFVCILSLPKQEWVVIVLI